MKLFAPLAVIYAMLLGGTSTYNVHRPESSFIFPSEKKQEKEIAFSMPAPNPNLTAAYFYADETHDFITYDTIYQEAGGQRWALRITRPANMFTEGHADTASRPAIIMMPGQGEAGSSATDTTAMKANTRTYGPHYWMDNGWDGGIQMPSGRRFPIIITVVPSYVNPRGPAFTALINHILNTYHIDRSSVHMTGLSMGAFTISKSMLYEASAGAETFMKLVKSMCLLQGKSDETFAPYNAWSRGFAGFGYWANKYDGKFFGLEGTNDTREVWKVSQPMNDSVPGSAYFSWEAIGAVNGTGGNGTHCCWNSMYDPSATNWQNFIPYGPNIRTSGLAPNTPGTYQTGDNLFTWMYKQGDTSMVGEAAEPNTPPTADAGRDTTLYAPTSTHTLVGGYTDAESTVTYAWTKVSGPSATIASPSTATTAVNNLTSGTYVFRLTVTDAGGLTDTDDVTIVRNAPPAFTPAQTAGLGEYQAAYVNSSGFAYGVGNLTNIGTNNTGLAGRPELIKFPAGLRIKQVAGGLHGLGFIDEYERVHVTGDNDQGQFGNGTLTHPYYYPSLIETDSAGHYFGNVKKLVGWFKLAPISANGFFAIKNDGTLWVWGRTIGGMRGQGTDSLSTDSFCLRPVQIQIPGGRLAADIVAGNMALLLCTDGTVWTWGNTNSNNLGYSMTGKQYQSPRQLTGLTGITKIAGGGSFNYAYKPGSLYKWGQAGNYMCDPTFPTGNGAAISTPTLDNTILSYFDAEIADIQVNYASTLVRLTNGKVYSWGDAAMGTIGDGQSLDWASTSPPYAWDGSTRIFVKVPTHIMPGLLFKEIYTSNVYTYYSSAQTVDGRFMTWGRGKAAVLPVGINMPNGTFQQYRQNAHDRKWPVEIFPFTIDTVYIATSPDCIGSSTGVCSTYTAPANTAPVANAGSNQTITADSVHLDASGSTDNVFISYYLWEQISGPNTAVIDLPGNKTAVARGLVDGTYTFRVTTTDNGWFTDQDTVTITVGEEAPPPVPDRKKLPRRLTGATRFIKNN